MKLPLMLIYRKKEGGRPIIPEHVDELASSMAITGQLHPIIVQKCLRFRNGQRTDAYEIVAGNHRFQAAWKLKWKEIDAILKEDLDPVDAELMEIDENLFSAGLSLAQRADHHMRREKILLAKGLVAEPKVGGDHRSSASVADGLAYTTQTAKALGMAPRTIRQDLARGRAIAPEVLASVIGTEFDRARVLDVLANTPIDQQEEQLGRIKQRLQEKQLNREQPIRYSEPEYVKQPNIRNSLSYKEQLSELKKCWNGSCEEAQEDFLKWIKDV